MRVEVYFNLHRRLFSVRALEGKRKGRVIDHLPECAIRDAKFVVSEAGRQRVLREQKKNVHAYVRGELVDWPERYVKTVTRLANDAGGLRYVRYSPYRFSYFFDEITLQPIHEAGACLLLKSHDCPMIIAV
jgi:hypothetical protein